VDILKFVGKHDPDDFLKWLHNVECIIEYKEIPNDKEVKFRGRKE